MKNTIIKNPKTKEQLITIDYTKEVILYRISKQSAQYKQLKKITIIGFTEVPTGLRKSGEFLGFGFTGQGYRIVDALYKKLGKYDLKISRNERTAIKKLKTKYNVIIKESDLKRLLNHLRTITNEKSSELRLTVSSYLHDFYSTFFPKPSAAVITTGDYKKGELADVLDKTGIDTNLSKLDKDKLISFYPKFLKSTTNNLASKAKLLSLSKSKNQTQVIYIETILKEYATKRKANPAESKWQDFLRDYILLFNLNYTDIIEKVNISVVKDKLPDFMLLDVYNYLDIFEIKKPTTPLMEFDESRNNFYWSEEMTKAIAQTECYIYNVSKNAATIKDDLETYKGLDVRVIKPRGYIIAGETNQLKKDFYKTKVKREKFNSLTNIQAQNGFRLLNESLRNVSVIFYDELISNLKSFLKRIKK